VQLDGNLDRLYNAGHRRACFLKREILIYIERSGTKAVRQVFSERLGLPESGFGQNISPA